MVEHLVEHETQKVAHKTQRESLTVVAHGIIDRTPKKHLVSCVRPFKKTRIFTFILHFLLPNLIVWLIIINLIDLLNK